MKTVSFKKIIDFILQYQKDNNVHVMNWGIGKKYLIFEEAETNNRKMIDLVTII